MGKRRVFAPPAGAQIETIRVKNGYRVPGVALPAGARIETSPASC